MKPAILFLLLAMTPHPAMVQSDTGDATDIVQRTAEHLGLSAAEMNVTGASWNGRSLVFADYPTGRPGEEERQIVMLEEPITRTPVTVTIGEQEGGVPRLLAIGFANADRDAAKELIVILAWDIRHYDVSGTMYDIRLLDDWKPGQSALLPLKTAERLFEHYACDCGRRGGPDSTARVKTIATVKQVLKRAGY